MDVSGSQMNADYRTGFEFEIDEIFLAFLENYHRTF